MSTPKPLVTGILIGAALIVFPVTKKFEFYSLLDEVTNLTDKVKSNPNDSNAKILLQNEPRLATPLKPKPIKRISN